MKNQYFGDIKDYRKYGLLRTLAGKNLLSIGDKFARHRFGLLALFDAWETCARSNFRFSPTAYVTNTN